jgi:hypothetical protein
MPLDDLPVVYYGTVTRGLRIAITDRQVYQRLIKLLDSSRFLQSRAREAWKAGGDNLPIHDTYLLHLLTQES